MLFYTYLFLTYYVTIIFGEKSCPPQLPTAWEDYDLVSCNPDLHPTGFEPFCAYSDCPSSDGRNAICSCVDYGNEDYNWLCVHAECDCPASWSSWEGEECIPADDAIDNHYVSPVRISGYTGCDLDVDDCFCLPEKEGSDDWWRWQCNVTDFFLEIYPYSEEIEQKFFFEGGGQVLSWIFGLLTI